MDFRKKFSDLERDMKDAARKVQDAAIKAKDSKTARQLTGRIAPEDLPELNEIRAYDFYDVMKAPSDSTRYTSAAAYKNDAGTWDVRQLHGSDRGAMMSNPNDVIAKSQSIEQAVAHLEKFEADAEEKILQRSGNLTINLPHWSKVKAALEEQKPTPPAPKKPDAPAA